MSDLGITKYILLDVTQIKTYSDLTNVNLALESALAEPAWL